MAIGFSPLAAIFSPHWWPLFLPAGGHESPHPHRYFFQRSAQRLDSFPGGRLGEAVAVLPVGDQDVSVVQ
jgi:hypothetical protein